MAANDTLELAQALARRGWFVFPCGSDKKPLCKWTHDSTLNSSAIDEYFFDQPGRLIGIDCKRSGIFAVDIDRKHGVDGLATWESWLIGNESIQDCPTQSTPSGGIHLVFTWPDGLEIPNAVGIGPGIDLRSKGYICTGDNYTWTKPYTITPPTPPDWLIQRIKSYKAPTTAPEAPKKPVAQRITQKPGKSTPNAEKWLQDALQRARPGNRNDVGFWLACQLRDNGISEDEALCNPYPDLVSQGGHPYTVDEWNESVTSAYTNTPRQPATKAGSVLYTPQEAPAFVADLPTWPDDPMPDEPDMIPLPPDWPTAKQSAPAANGESDKITTWEDMAESIGPIVWDWPLWMAQGILVILAGESGGGKSALALRVCGCYLKGWPWPDGTPFTGKTGAVLWCEAEAAQALNLSRAKAWGLPINKIYTPLADPLDDINLDAEAHRAALYQKAILPEVRLIVVDSMRGMHRGDENSSDTMQTVKWLAMLARDTGKPVILTHHLRKRSMFDGDGVDLDRLRGSSGIVQPARLIWALDMPDPQDKSTKRLHIIKSNLAKFPDPVGVTVGEAGVSFVDSPEKPRIETQVDKAIDLLLNLLQRGPKAATEIEQEFDQAGISIPTMKRAKSKLGIVSGKNATGWFWSLPARNDPPS